jgi:hypothetical protein
MKNHRQQRSRHVDQQADPDPPDERRSCRILLKAGDGTTHDLEVQCHQGGDLFHSFQAAVDREIQVPRSKQRFFIASGTKRLSTAAQLNSALKESEKAGEMLVVQVLPKTDSFVTCEQHPDHEKTAFCVPCRKFLCFKCLFTHVNNNSQLHTLADLEDSAHFTATVAAILQQVDQGLRNTTNNAAANKNSQLQNFTHYFNSAFAQRDQWSNALLNCSEFAVAKQRRLELRSTAETADWLAKRRLQSVKIQQLIQQVGYYGYQQQPQNPVPRLANLVAAEAFLPCATHPNLTECLYCVQCAKAMCPKCYALHGNRNQGHQCADMEDPQQFLSTVQNEVDRNDREMQTVEVSLTQTEQQLLQQLNAFQQQLWAYWTGYITSLKAEFDAEAKQIERNLATTPLELAQWLCRK